MTVVLNAYVLLFVEIENSLLVGAGFVGAGFVGGFFVGATGDGLVCVVGEGLVGAVGGVLIGEGFCADVE